MASGSQPWWCQSNIRTCWVIFRVHDAIIKINGGYKIKGKDRIKEIKTFLDILKAFYTDYFHLSYSFITWQKSTLWLFYRNSHMVFTSGEETLVNLNHWVPVMHCANCCVVLKMFQLHFNFCSYFQNRPDMHFFFFFTYDLLRRS